MGIFENILKDINEPVSQKDEDYLRSMCDLAGRFANELDCEEVKYRGNIADGEVNLYIILLGCIDVIIQTSDKTYLQMCTLADKVSFINLPDEYDESNSNLVMVFSKEIA